MKSACKWLLELYYDLTNSTISVTHLFMQAIRFCDRAMIIFLTSINCVWFDCFKVRIHNLPLPLAILNEIIKNQLTTVYQRMTSVQTNLSPSRCYANNVCLLTRLDRNEKATVHSTELFWEMKSGLQNVKYT